MKIICSPLSSTRTSPYEYELSVCAFRLEFNTSTDVWRHNTLRNINIVRLRTYSGWKLRLSLFNQQTANEKINRKWPVNQHTSKIYSDYKNSTSTRIIFFEHLLINVVLANNFCWVYFVGTSSLIFIYFLNMTCSHSISNYLFTCYCHRFIFSIRTFLPPSRGSRSCIKNINLERW